MVSLSTFCTEQVRRLAYFAHAVRSTMATVLLLGLASASISAPSLTSHDAAMPSPEVISGATISAMRRKARQRQPKLLRLMRFLLRKVENTPWFLQCLIRT